MYALKQKRHKLDSRTEETILLGHVPASICCKARNVKTGKVSIRQVAYFDEQNKAERRGSEDQ